jgi:hypothetical protein
MSRKEKDPEVLNEIRAWFGLPPVSPKKVKCLKCNKRFVSLGSHNRLCDLCKETNKGAE